MKKQTWICLGGHTDNKKRQDKKYKHLCDVCIQELKDEEESSKTIEKFQNVL